MTDLTELLDPSAVVAGMAVPNRKALFHRLGLLAEPATGLDARHVADRLAEREKLGTTGFGGGFAMPHARIEGLSRVTGFFVLLARPVDFSAIDDLPIDLVFALLSPADAGARHLKALAHVSRAFRDRDVRARLRGAQSRDALYALLSEIDARDAA